jgi:hypothetical protein
VSERFSEKPRQGKALPRMVLQAALSNADRQTSARTSPVLRNDTGLAPFPGGHA